MARSGRSQAPPAHNQADALLWRRAAPCCPYRSSPKRFWPLAHKLPDAYGRETIVAWIARRCLMPMYEYKCLDCGKESEVSLTLKDHETGAATCPSCKSTRKEQLISAVTAKTSRKS